MELKLKSKPVYQDSYLCAYCGTNCGISKYSGGAFTQYLCNECSDKRDSDIDAINDVIEALSEADDNQVILSSLDNFKAWYSVYYHYEAADADVNIDDLDLESIYKKITKVEV